MEYALYAIYYIFQSFFNMTMHLDVTEDTSVGSIIIAVMILTVVFASFGFVNNLLKKEDRANAKNNRKKE